MGFKNSRVKRWLAGALAGVTLSAAALGGCALVQAPGTTPRQRRGQRRRQCCDVIRIRRRDDRVLDRRETRRSMAKFRVFIRFDIKLSDERVDGIACARPFRAWERVWRDRHHIACGATLAD